MKKMVNLLLIGIMFFVAGADLAFAQKKVKVAMFLWRPESDGKEFSRCEQGFLDGLKEAGYDVDYKIFMANRKKDLMNEQMDNFNPAGYDLVYSFGTTVAKAVKGRNTFGLPHVWTNVTYPVKSKVAASMEKPGGSSTGTSHVVPVEANFKAFTKVVKNLKKIGLIYSEEPNGVEEYKSLKNLSEKEGLTLVAIQAKNGAEVEDACNQILAQGIDVMYLPSDSFMSEVNQIFNTTNGKKIVAMSNEKKVPTLGSTAVGVTQHGAMMGLVGDYIKVGRSTAEKAIQIIEEGKNPGDVPVSFLPEFDYVLNMKTAKEVGVTFPISILRAASEIIKE
ncbi:MAG: ABC transporter substrate-binding protein [Candidatus Omnitrophota bacterium]